MYIELKRPEHNPFETDLNMNHTALSIGLSGAAAVVVGSFVWAAKAQDAANARKLLDEGVKVAGWVTETSIVSREKWGVDTWRRASIEYAFKAGHGELVTGSEDAEVAFVEELAALPGEHAPVVDVLYLSENPAFNSTVGEVHRRLAVEYTYVAFCAFITGLFGFLTLKAAKVLADLLRES